MDRYRKKEENISLLSPELSDVLDRLLDSVNTASTNPHPIVQGLESLAVSTWQDFLIMEEDDLKIATIEGKNGDPVPLPANSVRSIVYLKKLIRHNVVDNVPHPYNPSTYTKEMYFDFINKVKADNHQKKKAEYFDFINRTKAGQRKNVSRAFSPLNQPAILRENHSPIEADNDGEPEPARNNLLRSTAVATTSVPDLAKQANGLVHLLLTSLADDCNLCRSGDTGVPAFSREAQEDRNEEEPIRTEAVDATEPIRNPTVVDVNDSYQIVVDAGGVDEIMKARADDNDGFECDWEFAQQMSPKQGKRPTLLDKMSQERLTHKERVAREWQNHKEKVAQERQAQKAARKQQSSQRLQNRLEKIYKSEQKIKSIDSKLGAWKKLNCAKKVNRYDDPSCAESTKSARTGLEVVHMDF